MKVQEILNNELKRMPYFESTNELYHITGDDIFLYANDIKIEYDFNFSLDENLQALYDKVISYELDTYDNLGV